MKPAFCIVFVFLGVKILSQLSKMAVADSLYGVGNYTAALKCYEEYKEKFGEKSDYFSELTSKRILQLKQEIHMKSP